RHTCARLISPSTISEIREEISPPAYSLNKRAALLRANVVTDGSLPFSKTLAASVRRLCHTLDLRTEVESKWADSRKISLVVAVTPEFAPPNTPAIHMGSLSELHIIKSSPVRVRSTSSRVLKVVPFSRHRTYT